jgi:8-oxo-dGTP pyrophosphatase MutT (NUDIX family)
LCPRNFGIFPLKIWRRCTTIKNFPQEVDIGTIVPRAVETKVSDEVGRLGRTEHGMEKERDPRISVRVGVIVRIEGKVLMALHEKGGDRYWVIPGGRLSFGESLKMCGRRELLEEANIRVRIGPILYVIDRTAGNLQEVCVIFRGSLEKGQPDIGGDPEDKGSRVLQGLSLISLEEFRELQVYPPQIKAAMLEDWSSGFNRPGRYLRHSAGE